MRDPAEHQAMEKLYNEAIDSSVTKHAADFMFRAHLLLRISDQDVEAAKDVIHIDAGREAAWREFQGLSEDERKIIGDEVGYQFSRLVKRAINKLWHACSVLQMDPTTLDPEHVALVAATLLSSKAQEED